MTTSLITIEVGSRSGGNVGRSEPDRRLPPGRTAPERQRNSPRGRPPRGPGALQFLLWAATLTFGRGEGVNRKLHITRRPSFTFLE